jgi:hypothetical protein
VGRRRWRRVRSCTWVGHNELSQVSTKRTEEIDVEEQEGDSTGPTTVDYNDNMYFIKLSLNQVLRGKG